MELLAWKLRRPNAMIWGLKFRTPSIAVLITLMICLSPLCNLCRYQSGERNIIYFINEIQGIEAGAEDKTDPLS